MAFGTETRAVDGCIVQFLRSDGERRTVVVTGPTGFVYRRGSENRVRKSPIPGARSALRAAIAQMESWPGEWKVEVISTPATILRDLQGSRRPLRATGHEAHDRGVHATDAHDDFRPERKLLGGIGRLDLLAG